MGHLLPESDAYSELYAVGAQDVANALFDAPKPDDGRGEMNKEEKHWGNSDLSSAITALAAEIHGQNKEKGFWEESHSIGAILMLVVTELAEALEAARFGDPPSKAIPGFSSVTEELADAVIRILDCCGHMGLDIGQAIYAKLEYNRNRPYKHGKEF